MSRCKLKSKQFQSFDYARSATDDPFSEITSRLVTAPKARCTSLDHKNLYGFKIEVSVLPSEIKIGCTAHYPGSLADLEILWKNKNFLEEASKNVIEVLDYIDTRKMQEYSLDYCVTLLDERYQGAAEDLRATHLTRTPAREALTAT